MPQSSICRGIATSVVNTDDSLTVTYHNTVVLFWDKKKDTVKLNNGGWITFTTALRINQAARQFNLGFCVGRKKGVMSYRFWNEDNKKSVEFHPTVTFNLNYKRRIALDWIDAISGRAG